MVCKNSVYTKFQCFQNGTNQTMIRWPTLKFPNGTNGTDQTMIGCPTWGQKFWPDRFLYSVRGLCEQLQPIHCMIRQNGLHIYTVCSFRMVKMGPIGQRSDVRLGPKIFVWTAFCIQSGARANCCNQYSV